MSRIAKMPIALPKGVEVQHRDGAIVGQGTARHARAPAGPERRRRKDGDPLKSALGNSNRKPTPWPAPCARWSPTWSRASPRASRRSWSWSASVTGPRPGRQAEPVARLLAPGRCSKMPEGHHGATPTQTEILISGIDQQPSAEVAAEIRAFRPPEPYKGKGVRYRARRSCSKKPRRSKRQQTHDR